MIPRDHITEWRARAPWVPDVQVEQDLVISRALVGNLLASGPCPMRSRSVAERRSTSSHLKPPARYSEDIDLVQNTAGRAGPIMDALHEALDPWLGKPQWKQTKGRVTFVYRFESEDVPPMPMRLNY